MMDAHYDFGDVRVATLALLTLNAPPEPRSCGVDIAKLSGHAVTLRSAPTVFADILMSASTSTRIRSGRPPSASCRAAIVLGLYRMKLSAGMLIAGKTL
jgi:hypothetical protein